MRNAPSKYVSKGKIVCKMSSLRRLLLFSWCNWNIHRTKSRVRRPHFLKSVWKMTVKICPLKNITNYFYMAVHQSKGKWRTRQPARWWFLTFQVLHNAKLTQWLLHHHRSFRLRGQLLNNPPRLLEVVEGNGKSKTFCISVFSSGAELWWVKSMCILV